ncbi:MAG: DUF711 family protein [Chloroflexi bacterium]|nr:DUF711 family protein [Chloroflexota bacterium]
MKIRSITCFCNPLIDRFETSLKHLTEFLVNLKIDIEKEGWEVQTTRLATTPFGYFTNGKDLVRKIQDLEDLARKHGFTYLSIGPARLHHREEYHIIPEILSSTENVFLSGSLTHPRKGISVEAIQDCAKIITEAARISPDGFTNLRFCATSQVRPFTPFFPASYSYGTDLAFAFAMECADAAVSAFSSANSLSDGRKKMLSMLNDASSQLEGIAFPHGRRSSIEFKGFDFSLAPFPEEWCSIGAAMESLVVSQLGFMGSLSTAAILMDTLDQGKWLRAGFNGLMLPVLEDSTLAARSENGIFSVKDLLMYSAVCGTGLDTVPLPGNISAEKIESLLMDIAALSLRLNKPLTARLMPVPGMESGQKTGFDFAFFKNGGVMDFPGEQIGGLIGESCWIEINKRSA